MRLKRDYKKGVFVNFKWYDRWQDEYEKLDKGIYRMKKVVYDGNMNEITIYSNIFEI